MKSNLLIDRGNLGRRGYFSRVERVEHVDGSVSRWLKSFVMAAAVCLAVPMANAADSLTMADFNHKIKLQVAGYTGTETLQNFPVLVRVSETRIPGFFFADMSAKNVNGKAMGFDLAFFAEDGTRLEIDKDVWNIDTTVEPTGEQLVWVKLPQMKQGTKFFMCYNVDDGKLVTNDKPWGDYVGVWHLNETGKNPTIADSTDNGLNGKALADNGEAVAAGKIGGARRIAKDNNHAYGIVIDATNGVPQKAVADSLGTDFHVSFWMMSKAGTDYQNKLRWGNIIGRRKGDNGYSWGFGFAGDDNGDRSIDNMRVHSDNTQGNMMCTSHKIGSSLKLDGVWNKVDLVWKYATNGNTPVVNIYTNGYLDETMTKHGVPVRLEDANIGIGCSTQLNPKNADGYKGRRFNGSMDEVRLRPGIVSDDWVKADFETVNDVNFIQPAPPDALAVAWASASGMTGVTNVTLHAAVVGGIVSGFGSNTTACVIQGKFWKDSESEPSGWTVLKENLALYEEFEISVPCEEGASYSYKLRAVDDDNGETEPVTGTFTVPTHISVTWAETFCVGVTNVFEHVAVIGGTLDDMGSSTSATVQGKFWHGETEPTEWTTVGEPLSQTGPFSVSISGLTVNMDYSFKLRVVGSSGATTDTISGTFTTQNELTVVWAAGAELPGIERISHGYVIAGGTIHDLGDSTSCRIVYKLWIDGESEPTEWTTLSGNLAENDTCHERITVLDSSTYLYKFKAVGDSGEETAAVSGTFTTMDDVSGETYYYDDGTNAFWVVNEFERFLPFTVTGYPGTETLTNFPVLVEVRKKDTNGFSYDDFYHTGGKDIAFVDDKGHVIPHEIDTWNPNGQSLIWVRLPEMNNGTKFTMCYRSPLVNPPADPGNTFEKYVGVWHMSEKGDGIVQVHDSTVNNLTGETHANSLADGNGRIGYARRVAQHSGTSSTYGHILINDHDDILRTGVGNVFTYSCWSKLADNAPGWAYLVSRKREDADKGWGIQYTDGDLNTKLRAWSGSTAKGDYTHFSVSGYSHKNWAYWTFVYSNTVFRAYLNGVEQSANWLTLEGVQSHNVHQVANDETAYYDSLIIGGQQIGTGALNGWVDECRYSKGMRSADWIKAEYYSTMQATWWNDPAKRFVTKGTVCKGDETPVPVVVWETGEGMPATVIDVSYAYVQFAGTVTFCGAGAETCWIEYQLWANGEEPPDEDDWTHLLDDATPGTKFSIPVFGLKQDMPYNFRIRAVNEVAGERRQTLEHTGSFRTNGNVNESAADGELMRLDNKFVHLYRRGEYTFTTPDYVTNIEIIVVGGGGAGGYKIGGGGGGGGVFYSKSYGVTTNTTYFITVGGGGIAPSNTTTASSVGIGEYSTFSLDSDHEHPLIEVPGGGGGGSCSTTANVVTGGDGASGGGAGGRGDTSSTGMSGGSALSVAGIVYGHNGGNGNHQQKGGSVGAYAAGGGGGGQREGLTASSDTNFGGGAGGSGVASDILGEELWFGAGGGGGYAYKEDGKGGYTKPGAGGSGIGGNAADVLQTPATSGVPNTGAGGGGGSMTYGNNNNKTYWQGGNGGDGVVIISYEVHGRDPVAEEPRISMTRCNYVEEVNEEAGDNVAGIAKIDYRLYWAGMQNDLADIYVHYSTVSSNDLESADGGEWVKVAEASVGIGSLVFVPPAVGYTYWVRLVARKGANSYAFSEEIASFTVPAISLTAAQWKEGDAPSNDYATVTYKLHDTNELMHVYCYWSENRAKLEGDEPPSGEGVFLLDLGANTGGTLSSKTTFNVPATEGLERNRTYYFRLASGDDQGIKLFPTDEIVELDTKETPSTVLNNATWDSSNVATVNFTAIVGKLDPEEVQLVALYSRVQGDVTGKDPETKESVTTVSLGFCADLGLDVASPSATFPLWSDAATNYYVRLALATNVVVNIPYSIVTNIVIDTPYSVVTNIVEDPPGVFTTNIVETAEIATTNIIETAAHVVTNLAIIAGSYSSVTKMIAVSAVEPLTLLYIVTANPKVMCYGDEPLPLDYGFRYAGLMEGWGWENKYELEGDIACEVTSTSPSGNYPITQGTLVLPNGGQEQKHTDDQGVEWKYQYKLTYSGATYTITNAVFTAEIEDVVTNYTGDAFDASGLVKTISGIRNEQPVTYRYRANGAGDWGEMPAFTNVGNHLVQFVASAPNHDDVHSSFKVTVTPAPLTAMIEGVTVNYTGAAITPAVVTNVTGLVRGDINPLTCEFRDEAGEWQREVPSFTLPGTYKVFFRASAPNHATSVTSCTVVVNGWDFMVNMDGMTGYGTPIIMGKPEWIVNNNLSGMTGVELSDNDTRYGALDAICANGLRLWQNYVLEREDFSKKVVATIMQQGSVVNPDSFVVHFPNIEPLMGTGLKVRYRLDRKLRRNHPTKDEFAAASFEIGELTPKYETNIPLAPEDPTGLYVFNIVFSPTNETLTGQSVIASCATIGVLRVSSALTNTVTVAPWMSMSVDSTNKIEVAVTDVVNPFCIGAGDAIHAYETEDGTFRVWERKGDGKWNSPATVNTSGVSQSKAEETTFAPGKAFWFVRNAPGPYIYLVGRYTGDDYEFNIEGGSADDPGHTLVANPTFFDVALDDLAFVDGEGNPATPADGDRIIFQDIAGIQTIYSPHATTKKWGRIVPTKVGRRVQNVWTEDGTNTVGTGFWYYRTGNETRKIKFEASK